MRVLGLDPGLRRTGWGVVDIAGARLIHRAHGTIAPDETASLAWRLVELHRALVEVVAQWAPTAAAVEETYMNRNARAALKLGHARAIALLAPAAAGLEVAEYPANIVKKAVVGTGHADKIQVQAMVQRLLTGLDGATGADAADALAVAICHGHHLTSRQALARVRA